MQSCLVGCHCGSHVISFDYDEDGFLFVKIWANEMTFWDRVKYLFGWKKHCIGEVVINISDSKQVIDFMNDFLSKNR